MAQIMNSLLPNSDLKKVGKTTRPFRYDLNQITYDYTVEMINRFKGLDLIWEPTPVFLPGVFSHGVFSHGQGRLAGYGP